VVDYPERLELIGGLIQQIDVRPPQVLVEATILVANVSDNNKLGVDFNILSGLDFSVGNIEGFGELAGVDNSDARISGTKAGVGTSSEGLKIGIFSSQIELMVEALESITDVVTLGNPKVLTLNRQQGKVLVGNKDGYITTEVSQTTATQTVEFLDTGTELRFRPFVMNDGYIRMDLFTSDSDGGVEVQGQYTLPSESTAEVTSNVLVKDGHTIVIGGLFRERTSITRSQVPILGDIPIVGPIFGESIDDTGKEEVIFLITPHIVQEKTDYAMAEKTMSDIQQKMLGFREGLMWTSRDRLSSAHYQWACQNQDEGKLGMALWNASLASYMNPGFLDAVKLKDELQGKILCEEEYGPMNNFMRNLIEQQMDIDTPLEEGMLEEELTWQEEPAVTADSAEPIELASDSVVVPDGSAWTEEETADEVVESSDESSSF
jgi:type II secretory pathway component GspD/PulD (secretin)